MFKNVRVKYVLSFALVIVFAFLALGAVLYSNVQKFAESEKAELLSDKASTVQSYLHEIMKTSATGSLQELKEKDENALLSMMMLVTENYMDYNDFSLVLTDETGKIVLQSDDLQLPEGAALSTDVLAMIRNADGTSAASALRGTVLDTTKLACSRPLYAAYDNESGTPQFCGMVILFSEKANWEGLLQTMMKAILVSVALVLSATLIVVYIVSMGITSTLRQMGDALKEYAGGNFEIRLPVRGRDELAQFAVTFNEMADDIGRLETLRNSFVANVSHDLRTPMTTIAGFVDGILDGVIPPEKEKYYLGIISAEVRRLSRLVSSLLDISRLESGDRKFTMEPFDICEMGRQILISFEQKIDAKHLDVSFECDEDRIVVLADRDAIYQVFYNLCDNAAKFSRDGGAYRIGIHTADGKVTVSVFNEGTGIPDADRPFVFERFYKADKSRGLDKAGLGLGLYIARTILAAHGEEIWVQSEYGRNCEFSFRLPRDKAHERNNEKSFETPNDIGM